MSPFSADPDAPLISFRNAGKRFGDGPPVLDSLDLEIRRGEFVSIVGPSGCGKSTLLRVVAGLSPLSTGAIVVDGAPPDPAAGEMAFVFQEPTLLPWLTAARNIEMPLRLRGRGREARRRTAERLAAMVGLGHAVDLYPRQLSGGMKMRVSIARALSLAPRILLLDEPFGALDAMTRDRLNEELLQIRRNESWTALLVTHSVAEAVFLSTRVVVLSGKPGRIRAEVDVPFPYPRTAELRQADPFIRKVGAVAGVLRAAGGG